MRAFRNLTLLAVLTAVEAVAQIPARFTDAEFWKFSIDMSENAGTFRSENLLSNETGYQMVIPQLLSTGQRTGKVYLGVGPEQNFTYIVALKPKMAIIFDIRRGNLLEHLMYKALFEISTDRADFISRLFTKPRPAGLDTTTSIDSIMNAYARVATADTAAYRRNKEAVWNQLTKVHSFPLTADDRIDLFWIYDWFYSEGTLINYSSSGTNGMGGGMGRGSMPTYHDLAVANDGRGLNRGFLGTEANWRAIKDLEQRNLIVPVMADFGGSKAIRAVGAWLKEKKEVVGAFYASNVEQYLFQNGVAWNYYANVAQLPIDSSSVILRSGNPGGGFGGNGMGTTWLCPIHLLLAANNERRINTHSDVFYYCR